ncbi:MAG: YdcH family protein [Oceanicaulis sp.]
MAAEARIRELDARHAKLEGQLADAMKSPAADSLQVAALKKRKLRIKEEIEDLRRRRH